MARRVSYMDVANNIVPDDFVEPYDEQIDPKQRTIKKPHEKRVGNHIEWEVLLEGLLGLSCPRPAGHPQKTRMLKIVPDDFFEPNDEPFHPKQRT